jgi:hypothetical protein
MKYLLLCVLFFVIYKTYFPAKNRERIHPTQENNNTKEQIGEYVDYEEIE